LADKAEKLGIPVWRVGTATRKRLLECLLTGDGIGSAL
jgi:hypothetical protein